MAHSGMSSDLTAPPAHGPRPDWESLPADLRARIEAGVGSRVTGAQTQLGGFSPGVAARLQLADSRRVFCKAACAVPNPQTPQIHRQELMILEALPPLPGVPRLLWSYDGSEDGWVVLISQCIDGRMPGQPWDERDLDRILAALTDLWAASTPSPVLAGSLPTASDRVVESLHGWRLIRDRGDTDRLEAWTTRHLNRLADLERLAAATVAGTTLLHFDLRADNLLLTPEQVWVVDWPHACVGAAWFDLVLFLPSVAMQGGPAPETLVARLPKALQPAPEQLVAGVAALAGYMVHQSRRPAPPGLPTVRAFQAAQGRAALDWLRRLTGWA